MSILVLQEEVLYRVMGYCNEDYFLANMSPTKDILLPLYYTYIVNNLTMENFFLFFEELLIFIFDNEYHFNYHLRFDM